MTKALPLTASGQLALFRLRLSSEILLPGDARSLELARVKFRGVGWTAHGDFAFWDGVLHYSLLRGTSFRPPWPSGSQHANSLMFEEIKNTPYSTTSQELKTPLLVLL